MSGPGYVYFLQPIDGGPVKIGWSGQPEWRFRTYCEWSPTPLRMLATVPAPIAAEFYIHGLFKVDRLHHEWFRETPELMAYIERFAQTGDPGPRFHDISGYVGSGSWNRHCLLADLLRKHGLLLEQLAEFTGRPHKTVKGWCASRVPHIYLSQVIDFFATHGATVSAADFLGEYRDGAHRPATAA